MENKTKIQDFVELSVFMPLVYNMLMGLGVLIVGWILARWAKRVVRKRLGNNKGLQANETIRPLIATLVSYTIMLATLYAALSIAGIPASGLLAAFGAAGLAIALAVQGTLANVAAGMMLIFLRSIKVGEYIQTPNLEGTVQEIGLFTTLITSPAGVLISVPNAQIWGREIHNFSRAQTRRLDVDIELARDNDLDAALKTISGALHDHKAVSDKDSISAVISGLTPTSVQLQARCNLPAANLRTDASDIRLALQQALQQGGFKLPPVPASLSKV